MATYDPRTLRALTLHLPFAALAFVGLCGAVSADEIDLNRVVQEKLAGTSIANELAALNSLCAKIADLSAKMTGQRVSPECLRLVLDNVRLTDPKVTYSEVKPGPIPFSTKIESFVFPNCDDDKHDYSRTVQLTYREGLSTVTTDSVSETSGVTANLTVKTLTLGASNSRVVNFNKQESVSHETSVTETVNIAETLRPWSLLLVTVERRISHAYLDFQGDLTVDGDIWRVPCCGWEPNFPRINYGRVKNLLGTQRITLRGQIWNATADSTKKAYRSTKLNKDSPQCSDGTPTHPSPLSLEQRSRADVQPLVADIQALTARVVKAPAGLTAMPLSLGPVYAVSSASTAASVQRIVAFVDGMTIKTGDVIANVEVRAKSVGPGMCGVTFTGGGGSTQFLAPPIAYSPWTVLTSHTGAISMRISHSVVCDTGVIAEIRFWM